MQVLSHIILYLHPEYFPITQFINSAWCTRHGQQPMWQAARSACCREWLWEANHDVESSRQGNPRKFRLQTKSRFSAEKNYIGPTSRLLSFICILLLKRRSAMNLQQPQCWEAMNCIPHFRQDLCFSCGLNTLKTNKACTEECPSYNIYLSYTFHYLLTWHWAIPDTPYSSIWSAPSPGGRESESMQRDSAKSTKDIFVMWTYQFMRKFAQMEHVYCTMHISYHSISEYEYIYIYIYH